MIIDLIVTLWFILWVISKWICRNDIWTPRKIYVDAIVMFDIRCLSADAETRFSLSLLINDFGIFLLPLLIPLPDPILIRKFFQIFRFFLFFVGNLRLLLFNWSSVISLAILLMVDIVAFLRLLWKFYRKTPLVWTLPANSMRRKL